MLDICERSISREQVDEDSVQNEDCKLVSLFETGCDTKQLYSIGLGSDLSGFSVLDSSACLKGAVYVLKTFKVFNLCF